MTFWRRKRKQPHLLPVVDSEAIIRRFLLDGRMAEAQQLGTLVGLSPVDAETAAEEQAESDARARRVAPFVPIITLFSSVMAGSVIEYLRTVMDDQSMSDDEAEAMAELMQKMCLSTAVGTVTQLEDLGLLHYGHHK